MRLVIDIFTQPAFSLALGLLCLATLWWVLRRLLPGQGRMLFIALAFVLVPLFVFNRWLAIGIGLLLIVIVKRLTTKKQIAQASYQPAAGFFEGGGIKRGLTAPEAAVLLGKPLDLILTLVLVNLLRKGFVQFDEQVISVSEVMQTRQHTLNPTERAALWRLGAQKLGKVLYTYEEPFLALIEQHAGRSPLAELDWGVAVRLFVDHVVWRVGGYDLAQTQAYYQAVILRTPKEVRHRGELLAASESILESSIDWLLLHESYPVMIDQKVWRAYRPAWTGLDEGQPFTGWLGDLQKSLQNKIAAEDLQMRIGKRIDATTANLMADISRATYHS